MKIQILILYLLFTFSILSLLVQYPEADEPVPLCTDCIDLADYLNTDYAPIEALGMLRVLDEMDKEKYPAQNDLVQSVDGIGFSCREVWVSYLPDTTFYYQKSAKEWVGPLKTYPDYVRMFKRLANLLARQSISSDRLPQKLGIQVFACF